jgi:endonuclease/exonuclease/phosphatase (EEP) superfamily protein YafD
MLFKPRKLHHRRFKHEPGKNRLPEHFGVLCWNVHKNNRPRSAFLKFIRHCRNTCNLSLMLLQEADIEAGAGEEFDYYDAAANLFYRGRHYGVLSASVAPSSDALSWLCDERELFFATHKSILITRYKLADGSDLLVANVHAVNFRENGAFDHELTRLYEQLQRHKGALIVGGDFNTWNKRRLLRLYRLMRTLRLKRVPFKDAMHIKSFGSNRLDHLFYRGLRLHRSFIPEDGGISDHRPLWADFSKR